MPRNKSSLIKTTEAVISCSILSLIILAALINIFLALQLIPIPAGDKANFVPIALNYVINGSFSHPFVDPISHAGSPFVWHGWLYPWLIALFNLRGDYAGAMLCDQLLAVTSSGLAAILCYRRTADLLVTAVCLLVFYEVSLYQTARPEGLAGLFLLLLFIARGKHELIGAHPVLSGVLLGILSITQPLIALLSSIAAVLLTIAPCSTREALRRLLALAATTALTLCILTALFHPHSLPAWLNGVFQHIFVAQHQTPNPFGAYYLRLPMLPLAVRWLPPVGLIPIGWLLSRTHYSSTPVRIACYLLCFLFIAGIWWAAIRVPQSIYRFAAFIPIIVLFAIEGAQRLSPSRWRYARVALCMFAAPSLVGISFVTLTGISSYQHGLSYSDLQADLLRRTSATDTIAVPKSLGILFFDRLLAERILVKHEELLPLPEAKSKFENSTFYILPQANSGLQIAPTSHSLTIAADRFFQGSLLPGGFLPIRTPKAFNYALYRRNKE